jgi:UDP-glucose 4-epimerase
VQSVLITGAGGFIAGHAARAFSAAGWRTIGAGRSDRHTQAPLFSSFERIDLNDAAAAASLLDRVRPDAVVHLAAPSSVPQSMHSPLTDFHGQLLPAAHLFEAVRLSVPEARIVLVSSAAVYGNAVTLPVAESAPLAPISAYGFHKLQQELLADEYVALYALRVCKARIFSTYGENLRRLAVWDIARRALAGNYDVYGTGEETRDYLDVHDVARALVCLGQHGAFRGEAVNVASGQEISIRTLASEIFRLLGIDSVPRFTGQAIAGNPLRWRADVGVLRALGCSPAGWADGLARTLQWLREQQGSPE